MDLKDHVQSALGNTYAVERELGGGGMSRVFLARDERLGREIVVKMLPPETGGAVSLERFKREISVAARLQHPHIVPVLAAGEIDDIPYYTMPFIEGENLRTRLLREGELPVSDVVSILREVTRALAYAHERGVVHRDIKPDNVLLSAGSVMVTDFGVAKALSVSAKEGRTSLTQLGVALGTPAYMSPEQAAADPAVDRRADFYALGCMAYELLSGQPPFVGRPTPAILAAQVSEQPESIARRRPDTPPQLAALVMCCLEKRPADRPQSAAEVLRALDTVIVTPAGTSSVAVIPAPPTTTGALRFLPWALAAVLGSAVIWLLLDKPTPAPRDRVTFPLVLGDSVRLRNDVNGVQIAISPDGSRIAYVGGVTRRAIYTRRLDELTSHLVEGSVDANDPVFSPDGKWLAFRQARALKKVLVGGGPTVTVADSIFGQFGWGDDDAFVYQSRLLWRVTTGGIPQSLTSLDSARHETNHVHPVPLPGGREVVYSARVTRADSDELAVVRVADHSSVRLGLKGGTARYIEGGYLVFGRHNGTLAAVRFDPKDRRVSGPVITVLEGVDVKGGGATNFDIARNGTLVYVPGRMGTELSVYDRHGGHHPILVDSTKTIGQPALSPDGKRVAFVITQLGSTDIWVLERASGTMTRVTTGGRSDRPQWTPDGRRIAWRFTGPTGHFEIRWRPQDGATQAETLVDGAGAVEFSRAKDVAVIEVSGRAGTVDIELLALDSTRRRTPVINSPADDFQPRLSPDGQWLAYTSDQSGRYEVYVRRLGAPGPERQVSSGGGDSPGWNPSGKEVFYRHNNALFAATIALQPELSVVKRDSLFPVSAFALVTLSPYFSYDIAAGGQGFFLAKPTGTKDPPVVILNWTEEVRQRVLAAGKK